MAHKPTPMTKREQQAQDRRIAAYNAEARANTMVRQAAETYVNDLIAAALAAEVTHVTPSGGLGMAYTTTYRVTAPNGRVVVVTVEA